MNSQNRRALDLVGLRLANAVVERKAPSVSNVSRWALRVDCGHVVMRDTSAVRAAVERGVRCEHCSQRDRLR